MAELKKYLDQTGLSQLVINIKAEDTKTLDAAKAYTDSAAKNYDAAGSSATAESNAKAYTDQLANGQVKTNTDAIAKLNGDATTEGSVAKAVADAKATIDADIDAVEAKADKNAEDIAAINNETTGILAQAKSYTDTEVAKVQGEVDALETYVGTIPEGATATNVVAYVQEKTAGIATSENLEELTNRVAQAETDIDNIEKDYLKAADKTELSNAIAAEKSRAEGIEGGLETRLAAVEGDYLKTADKTELTEAIAAAKQEAIETVLGEGEIAESFDTLKEVADWIQSDTTGAAALQTRVSTLEGEMDTVQADMTQAKTDIDNVEAAVATKVEQSAFDEKVGALEDADADLSERLDAVEAQLGDGENSVSDLIAIAKQEAIEAAAGDATTKANQALTDAKAYADAEDAKIESRVDALEDASHSHSNKALLDTYTQTEANLADAVAKKHEHANKTELDKIADGDVAKWNAAEQNAKTYADGLNTAMTSKVDGIDGRLITVEGSVATKAEADDLDAAVERISANETAIAANTSAINSFSAISTTDIDALFA